MGTVARQALIATLALLGLLLLTKDVSVEEKPPTYHGAFDCVFPFGVLLLPCGHRDNGGIYLLRDA